MSAAQPELRGRVGAVLALLVLAAAAPLWQRHHRHAVAATSTVAGATRASFSVGANGSATYEVPIAVPPGTHDMQPKLALIYNSQAGDGFVGAGWLLDGLPAIGRCGATILEDGFAGSINYNADDRFCLQASGVSDGRLQPATPQSTYFVPGTVYRTEKETWSQVVASTTTCGSGPCSFQVTLRGGTVLGFGTAASGQVAAVPATTTAPPPSGSVRTWLLTQVTDLDGNSLAITYATAPPLLAGGTIPSVGTAYPVRIDYTLRSATPAMSPMRSVQFYYSPRTDSSYAYQGGAVTQNAALLTTIQTCIATTTTTPVTGLGCGSTGLQLVKQYNLGYGANALTQQSVLASLQECDGGGNCFPATQLAWSAGANGLTATPLAATHITNNNGWVADFNGDGRTDLLSQYVPSGCPAGTTDSLYLATGTGFAQAQCVSLPTNLYPTVYVADYNGDGYADVLLASDSGGVIYFSTGTGIGTTPTNVSISLDSTTYVGDVNGDGMADLVTMYASSSGSLYLATGSGFASAIPIGGMQTNQGQTWLLDFNGDGRADLFSAGSASGTLYLSTGSGFAAGIAVENLDLYNGATWIGDFNGDGFADLFSAAGGDGYMSYGNGAGFEPAAPITGLQLQQGLTWIGDFNGDGLMDIYSAGANQGTIYYALRGGQFSGVPAPGQNMSPDTTWLGDFNGDGAADLYAPQDGQTNDIIYFASQNGAVQSASQAGNLVTSITDGAGGQTALSYLPLTNPAVYARQTQPSNQQLDMLLVGNTVRYTPLSPVQTPLYPNLTLQNPLYVVSTYTLQNAAAENAYSYSYTYNYFYTQSLLNLLGRGWLGFASVTRTDPALGATATSYYQQDFPYNGSVATRVTCPINGLTPCPASGGTPLTTTSRSYTCQDTQSFGACQVSNTQYVPGNTQLFQVLLGSESDADTSFGTTVQTDHAYDNYGNPTLTSDLGDVQNKSHPVYTCSAYLNSTQPWTIGYLQTTKVSSTDGCTSNIGQWNPASDLRLTQLQYDGNMNVTDELHWDDQHSIWLGAQFTYDGYGNQLSDTLVSGATPAPVPGFTFTTSYETTYNSFAQTRTTPTPDPADKSSQPLVATFAYDARFGTRVAEQDYNGHIHNTCLDSFGRQSATEGPPPSGVQPDANCLTSTLYPYLPGAFTGNTQTVLLSQTSWTQSGATLAHETERRNHWDSATSWLASTAYLDGLERAYRMVTATDTNQRAYVDRSYKTPTLVARVSLPYVAGATPSYITESYDACGRRIEQLVPYQAPDGSVGTSETHWAYSAPATITATQVAGSGSDYVVRTAFEYYNNERKPVASVIVNDDDARSTYSYDLLGSLTGALSPAGSSYGVRNQAAYDSLGRRTSFQESNTGTVRFFYNSYGELDHQLDQKQQRIAFQYDHLMRQTGQARYDAGGSLTQRFTYRYDVAAAAGSFANLRGALSGVTAADTSGGYLGYAYGYDPYQHTITQQVSYPGWGGSGQTLTFRNGYDPMGRQISRHYPDALQSVVNNLWSTSANDLSEVTYANAGAPDPVPYLTYSDYTPFNTPQQAVYGNGDSERLTYDVSGKPASRTLTTASAAVLQSLVYGWDTLGNLVSTLDCNYQGNNGNAACTAIGVAGSSPVNLGQTLTLTSNRLTQATGPFGSDQAQTTLGFAYDTAGNMTQSGGVTYTYSGHQAVSGSAGGSQVFQAIYDADGNACFQALGSTALDACPAPSTAPSGVTSYIYSVDVDNQLSAVQRNNVNLEAYAYDNTGRRVQKTVYESDGVTVASTVYYVAPDYEVTVPAGGSAQTTLFLAGQAPRAVALTSSGGAPVASYYYKDLTDSTVVTTGSGGSATSQIVYQPYGAIASQVPAASAPASTLFQSKELDSTGLYYFSARYLDPGSGRLTSADDAVAGTPYAQDALNRYAFALNNPAVYQDPSGNTPLAIMAIIFQVIFDVLVPEDIPMDVALGTEIAEMVDRGAQTEAELLRMSEAARDTLRTYGWRSGGTARRMAWRAFDRLDDADLLGNRAKITIAITRDGIYGDLSGAADTGDVVRGNDLSTEMADRNVRAQRLANSEVGHNSYETWQVNNCAEFRVCNRLTLAGEDITDIQEMHTVDLRAERDAPRCRNCQRTTWDVDRDAITSDRGRFSRRQLDRLGHDMDDAFNRRPIRRYRYAPY